MLRNVFVGFALFGLLGSAAGCDEIVVLRDPVGRKNNAPTWDVVVGSATVTEGVEYRVVLSASDANVDQTVRYELVTKPDDVNILTLNAESGELTWTPSFGVVKAYEGQETFQVKVRATDGEEDGSIAQTINIVVHNDFDEDGTADIEDADDDNDGLDDTVELAQGTEPNNPDTDDDGKDDGADNCPALFNDNQTDSDTDGLGDVCDVCPNDPRNDPDGDGVCESADNCTGDPLDPDYDALDYKNPMEDCDGVPATDPEQCDADNDGLGDVCDTCPGDTVNDPDLDGKCAFDSNGNVTDNCPQVRNELQENQDGDAFGDACDVCPNDATNDQDSDGVCEDVDNCPGLKNDPSDCDGDSTTADEQCDADGDNKGDACDTDDDDDGKLDGDDNCPLVFNPDQENGDGDDMGDVCDSDDDNDGVDDGADNCPMVGNANQVDLDGDDIGYQCDPISEIPNSLHLGKAISRIAGHAAGGTLALAFRGGENCAQTQFCEKPGVLVLDGADNMYQARYDSADSDTDWLNLLPPGGQMARPFVSTSGAAFFATESSGNFDLHTITDGMAAETFGTGSAQSAVKFFQGADGHALAQLKSSLASNPGLVDLEQIANGNPTLLRHTYSFLDDGGKGAFQSKDFTWYFPFSTLSGDVSLYAHTGSSFGPIAVPLAPTGTTPLENKPEIKFVAEDPSDGGVWYCWRDTGGAQQPQFIKLANGVVTRSLKLSGVVPCSDIVVTRAGTGTLFFNSPGVSPGSRRLQYANPSDSAIGFVLFDTDETIKIHFAGTETFIETVMPDGGSFFRRFRPSDGSLGMPINTVIYNAVVTTNDDGWLGYLGRASSLLNGQVSDLIGGRFKNGVTNANNTVNDPYEKVFSSGVLTIPVQAWISPVGDLWAQYTAGNGDVLHVYAADPSLTTPSGGLTPVTGTTSQPGASVTFHGAVTLVSYKTSPTAGKLASVNVRGPGTPNLTELRDIRGVHRAFLATLDGAPAHNNWITYVASDGSSSVGQVEVFADNLTLTEPYTNLWGGPVAQGIGPDGQAYFVVEHDAGSNLVSIDSTGGAFEMIGNAAMITLVTRKVAGRAALHGVVFRMGATSSLGYCNLPTGCWTASEPDHSPKWGPFVDEDANVYMVTQQNGDPATSPVHLWRNIGASVESPADL